MLKRENTTRWKRWGSPSATAFLWYWWQLSFYRDPPPRKTASRKPVWKERTMNGGEKVRVRGWERKRATLISVTLHQFILSQLLKRKSYLSFHSKKDIWGQSQHFHSKILKDTQNCAENVWAVGYKLLSSGEKLDCKVLTWLKCRAFGAFQQTGCAH